MWDLIVSVPDHCLSFYFPIYIHSMGDLRAFKGSHIQNLFV